MEMSILAHDIFKMAKARRWNVNRFISGHTMTALEMAGISLTVLKQLDGEVIGHLDYPVQAPGWPKTANQIPGTTKTIEPVLGTEANPDHKALPVVVPHYPYGVPFNSLTQALTYIICLLGGV